MYRFTGKEAFGLMEAYQAVYQPELTEEQVWEGVENWVHSLLEQGYDLSDYTWEEMYENYIISEQQGILGNIIDAGAGVVKKPIEDFANKKVGGIPGALGIPGAVAGQKVDQTAQQLKNKDFGGAFKTVAGGVQSLMQSHDLYDTILSHLMNEGYADTVENAESIMVNMSENWRESILSEEPVQDYRDMERADQNRRGARGREFTHDTTPGLKGIPQPGSAASGGKYTKSPAPAGSGSIRSMPSPGPVGSGSIRSMPSPGPVGSGSIRSMPSPSPKITYPKPSLDAPYPRGGANMDASAGSITLNKNKPGDDFIGPTVSTGGNTYGIPNPKFGRPQR